MFSSEAPASGELAVSLDEDLEVLPVATDEVLDDRLDPDPVPGLSWMAGEK